VTTGVAPYTLELDERAPRRLADSAHELADALARAEVPGATLLVVDVQGPVLRTFGGWSCVVGDRVPTERDTIYDLASLTKVVATTTLVLALAERGEWSLDDPVARALPDFPRGDISLRRLLTHTSGLVPHREFYRLGRGAAEIAPLVYAEARDASPGTVEYSDLNFMLLGWALEALAGAPLDELFAREVAQPLALDSTSFRPSGRLRRRIAATELDGDQRLEPGLVWGEVHDGNAWALGGVAGHAGLFATADDLGRFAATLLATAPHPVLGTSTRLLTEPQAGGPGDVRSLGWRLDASGWGPWPPSTYWHTGFTGTSLLVAPQAGVAVVLLAGGVHPVRRLEEVEVLRTRVHHLVAGGVA
jgi:CubicO group peptidase (beta-lactamase class C family)